MARDEADDRVRLFRSIFTAEFTYVCRCARRFGIHESDVEDVAIEVFVTVYRRLGDYEDFRAVRPWLVGITYQHARNWKRKARQRPETLDVPEPQTQDEAVDADERIHAEEVKRQIWNALQGLEIDRRAVLVMHDLEEQTMPEIARALSIPLNTAYSRLRLAREHFRAAIERLRKKGAIP